MIKKDSIYVFKKSGNKVRTLKKTSKNEWSVERIDTKKKMIVLERALVSVKEWEELCQ